ncbi:MarR family winged helix-turn-helix transcriptional regulator [Sediminimonas qiaohouensis]|uniref:MarR family winged helix-turn-helix transcriptional regulator n=1 Tax=Sediminimonas qiaohouensis TaxID=552061 RepID=UPI0004250A60|nr:MarR family transcriptional regulator [Sediminimonas qiaohouensis]
MHRSDKLFRLLWLSRPLMQRVEELVRRNLDGTGLTVRMRAVLEILEARGALSVPDIGRALQIQRQYVQVMVNEVIAAGLADKRANPRHRASPLIRLTPPGRNLIRDVLAQEKRKAEQLCAIYTDEDIAAALSVVERLCAQLDSDAEATLVEKKKYRNVKGQE